MKSGVFDMCFHMAECNHPQNEAIIVALLVAMR